MKALVKRHPTHGLGLEQVEIPQPGPEDVLVRIHKTGICGTDLHIYKWDGWAQKTIPIPLVIGHEYAGEIAEIGSAVKNLSVGQRVTGEGHLLEGPSRASRSGRYHLHPYVQGLGVNAPGAFAEFVKIPAFNVVALPDDIDEELGAMLDPLGNAVHTALSFDLIGEDVLITGAGPIGIMSAAVARHVGARRIVITDINPRRLELAGRCVDAVPVNSEKEDLNSVMQRLGLKEGFDVALEMSGSAKAFEQIMQHMVMGGKIAMLGLPVTPFPIDWSHLVLRMLTIKGIYGREMFETWHKMLAMLQSGLNVRQIITHRFKAQEFETAFQIMESGDCGKIILNWQEN